MKLSVKPNQVAFKQNLCWNLKFYLRMALSNKSLLNHYVCLHKSVQIFMNKVWLIFKIAYFNLILKFQFSLMINIEEHILSGKGEQPSLSQNSWTLKNIIPIFFSCCILNN